MNKLFKTLNFILNNNVSIVKTILFNFHYFSFSDAWRFPIILYRNVRLKKMKGEIIISDLSLNPGMVHIGNNHYGFQTKHDYTIWKQNGGTVIFEANESLGQGTFILVGENAVLKLERNVHFGGDDRIICNKSITIKSNTMIGWNVHIMDTDFHATVNTISKTSNSYMKAIIIGKNNWLCFGSIFMKGSITPDFLHSKDKYNS